MKLLYLKEIAKKLDKPASSVRYYADIYSEFLPSQKVEGVRWDMYEPEAVDILRLVFTQKDKAKSREEIRDMLSEKYQPVYDGEVGESDKVSTTELQQQQPQGNNAPITTIVQQMSSYTDEATKLNRQIMSHVQFQRQALELKDEQIGELEETVQQQSDELDELRRKVEQLEDELVEERDTVRKLKKGNVVSRLFG